MFTPEEIQAAIGERISEIETLFGEDSALWYKVGFMECVQFMIDMNKLLTESSVDKVNEVFNKNYPTTGGIN
jgi:hypothetical protein